MSTSHLSSEEFDALLSEKGDEHGSRRSEAEAHVAACETCADELASLRSLLGDFRSSATAFAEREYRRPRPGTVSTRPRLAFFAWPAVAACALAIAFAPLHRSHTVATPAAVTTAATSDDKLMNAIDADLSASTPEALEPLSRTASPAAKPSRSAF